MHDTYIMVDDDPLDGTIYVRANDDSITERQFHYYNDRTARHRYRNQAEHYAQTEASRLRCDWGTNYND